MSRRDAYDALEERVDETFEALVADLEDYDLTPSQKRNVRVLLAEGLAVNGIEGAVAREFKEASLDRVGEYSDWLALYVVVGRKGDEGTAAEIYCRERGHFFLSRRGGVSFYRAAKIGSGRVRVVGLRKARIEGFRHPVR